MAKATLGITVLLVALPVLGATPRGQQADPMIEKARAIKGNVILFAHGHVLRVFAARWLGLSASEGQRFLLDTATMNILSFYRGIPAVKRWNAPVQF